MFRIVYFTSTLFYYGISFEANKIEFPLGSDFPSAVRCKYFVDKTLFLKEFLEDENTKYFVTAPRNFGKSLNLQMLKYYLEIQVDQNGNEITNKRNTSNFQLFNETKFYKEQPEFFMSHFGQYPIIFVDYGPLAEINSYGHMISKMREILRRTFTQHKYLLYVDNLWEGSTRKEFFNRYIDPEHNINLNKNKIKMGFEFLSKILYKHFQRQPIMLIDEYNSFVNSILFYQHIDVDGIFGQFNAIHRSLFKISPKIVRKIFCTGIFHITGAGLSRIDKDLTNYAFLQNHPYYPYYGMTQDELMVLLQTYTNNYTSEIQRLKMNIDEYYGGYTTAEREEPIYNIKSVLLYLKNNLENNGRYALRTYWDRPTFFNSIVSLFDFENVMNDIISLIENGTTNVWHEKSLSKDDILDLKNIIDCTIEFFETDVRKLVFNFLLQLGYVTYKNNWNFEDIVTIILPNNELKTEIQSMLYISILLQFRLESNTIDIMNYNIDQISELNCNKQVFQTIFTNFENIFIPTFYNPRTESAFECHLFSFLIRKFNIKTLKSKKVDGVMRRLYMQFTNKHNISFIIHLKLMKKKREISGEQMKNCTKHSIEQIIKNNYREIIEHPRKILVALGICLGVMNSCGRIKKIVGLGYSKEIKSGDNINNTELIFQ